MPNSGPLEPRNFEKFQTNYRAQWERLLAGIWVDVLGLKKVSSTDNFFELGGDSLAVVRVIVKLYDASGVELPVASFLESPTIVHLAMKLSRIKPRCDDHMP